MVEVFYAMARVVRSGLDIKSHRSLVSPGIRIVGLAYMKPI